MMLKQRFFWLLVVVLLALIWGGYNIYSERKATAPGEEKQRTVREEKEMAEPGNGEQEAAAAELELQYFGHGAFLLRVGETRFLMDPYDPNCGYGKLDLEADYITVSHEHMDHNYIAAASGAKPIRGLSPDGLGWEDVSLSLGGIQIFTIPTYHDAAAGKLRGRNAVFVFDTGELRLVHLGDLGHLLSPEQVEKLTPVHVLLLPVGGHFTIDAAEARQLMDVLAPAVVVPMHYRTEATRNWPIAPLDEFLKGVEKVPKQKDSVVTISRDTLPQETEIWVMEATAPRRKE
ncbi:MAG: MBL fold metallo-hydrolase [Bacillota bacterium]